MSAARFLPIAKLLGLFCIAWMAGAVVFVFAVHTRGLSYFPIHRREILEGGLLYGVVSAAALPIGYVPLFLWFEGERGNLRKRLLVQLPACVLVSLVPHAILLGFLGGGSFLGTVRFDAAFAMTGVVLLIGYRRFLSSHAAS